MRTPIVAMIVLLVALVSRGARADGELELHGGVAGSHAVVDPQQRELGFGVAGLASLGMMFGRVVGLQLEGGGLYLPRVNPPLDPTLAAGGDGTAITAMLGPTVRPFGATRPAGLWLDANGGLVHTGSLERFGFDAHLGYDFRVAPGGRFDIGPFAGYLHVFQPGDNLRPEDANVLMIGVRVGLGASPSEAPAPPPVVPPPTPVRTDRDHDGVFDDEDACPDVPGIRTNDPKTNGCPRPDRDHDTVFDDEDACPDVPGVRTSDPKTNGCPPPQESVHVEKNQILLDDKIYFETDIARVKHISWPLVQKLAKFLNDNPDIVEVSIEGHADEVGGADYNLLLSKERAKAVLNLLVHFGVDPKRLTSTGWGETRPVVQGHDEAAHSKNRRVEFIITRVRQVQEVPPTPPAPPAPATPSPPPPSGGG